MRFSWLARGAIVVAALAGLLSTTLVGIASAATTRVGTLTAVAVAEGSDTDELIIDIDNVPVVASSPEVKDTLRALAGSVVRASGKMSNGTFTVSSVALAGPRPLQSDPVARPRTTLVVITRYGN